MNGRIMTRKSKGPALPQKMTSTQGAVPLMRAAVPLGEPNRVGKDGWLSKKHQHVAGTKFQHLWEKCSSNLVGTLFLSRIHRWHLISSGWMGGVFRLMDSRIIVALDLPLGRIASAGCGSGGAHKDCGSVHDLNDHDLNMGVSKNRGTPKWMIYNGNPY